MPLLQDNESKQEEDYNSEKESGSGASWKKIFKIFFLLIIALALSYFYYHKHTNNQNKNDKSEFVEIPEMFINLKSKKNSPHSLRVSFFLEISDQKEKKVIEKFKPIIIDHFQTYLRELDVSSLHGSNALEHIKQELFNRINNIIKPVEIKNILIREFFIQ